MGTNLKRLCLSEGTWRSGIASDEQSKAKGGLMLVPLARCECVIFAFCALAFGMPNTFVAMKSCDVSDTGLYSSVAERQSCKLKVLGSIPSGGSFSLKNSGSKRARNDKVAWRCNTPCGARTHDLWLIRPSL